MNLSKGRRGSITACLERWWLKRLLDKDTGFGTVSPRGAAKENPFGVFGMLHHHPQASSRWFPCPYVVCKVVLSQVGETDTGLPRPLAACRACLRTAPGSRGACRVEAEVCLVAIHGAYRLTRVPLPTMQLPTPGQGTRPLSIHSSLSEQFEYGQESCTMAER